ncbi:extradiol dioxygenase [Mangrovactinospora gilvigrisea]|uniref:Extradiol dioxygenase n=1 Tax=Mangrovactinospora gilvigrisea TaxID=1428644 RepID=A0A1J7BZU7_9ACTN|nr:extradiol dioxygenase [Mangrovactinospora gilvigrisea]OIV39009.1 extradiol dioxygenase [Mangrovactinospora gilvigrisea]
MISGAHVVVYSRDAEADRAFLKDVLGLDWVDAGGGWLIFRLPPAEVAVHPAEAESHELMLMCEDLEAARIALRARGHEFSRPVKEARWGRVTALRLPGGGELALYQPHHPSPPAS